MADSKKDELPEGFVIDALPPGFVLDGQAPASPQQVAPPPGDPRLPASLNSILDFNGGRARLEAQMKSQYGLPSNLATDMATQGSTTAMGMNIGARLPGSLKVVGIPAGAAIGSLVGYLGNQYRKGDTPTPGGAIASAASGGLGGMVPSTAAGLSVKVPFFGTKDIPKSSMLPVAATANATIGVAAGNAENLIDRKEWLPVSDNIIPALMGAGGTYIGHLADTGKYPASQRSARRLDAPVEAFRQKVIAEGGAFSPAFESPSSSNADMGKLAKSSALTVEFQRKNIDWKNNKARALLGSPADESLAAINPKTGERVAIERFKAKQNDVYAAIDVEAKQAQVDLANHDKNILLQIQAPGLFRPSAADVAKRAALTRKVAIETSMLKTLQENEKVAWRHYHQDDVPGGRDQWRDKALAAAKAQEDIMVTIDSVFTGGKLLPNQASGQLASDAFKSARKNLAMANVLDSAIDARGNVDGAKIFAVKEAGRKLTGPLDDIARAYGMARKVQSLPTQDHASARTALGMAGIAGTGLAGAGAAGSAAHAMGFPPNVVGAVGLAGGIGGVIAAEPASQVLRSVLASKWYQTNRTTPNYGANIPDYLATTARQGVSAQGLEYLRKYEAKKFDEKNGR